MVDAYWLVQRQWDVGMAGRICLRWEGITARLRAGGYSKADIAEVAEGFDVIEAEQLAMDERRRKAEKKD